MCNDQIGLYDIYGVHHVLLWHEFWFVLLMCAVIVIISLSIACFFYYKTCTLVDTDIWSICMRDLRVLRTDKTNMDLDQVQLFYDRLINILKKYVRVRYGFAHQGLTDGELYTMIQNTNNHDLVPVMPILERSVAIKFGKTLVADTQVQKDYAAVRYFVESTKLL
jgi:hypothetical protein